MKEVIETTPVIEAFESGDECPFCYLERWAEQRAINYVAGPCASYMEPEVRAITDSHGFCGSHLKKLYDFGNSLGNALMMQTHLIEMSRELEQELKNLHPSKRKLFSKAEPLSITDWLRRRNESCYLCSRVENSKGFCFRHFEQLLRLAPEQLPNAQFDWFYETVPTVFKNNIARVQEDLDWFIAKYDYRNAGADWKNSRDAVSRTMEKLQGLHPADPPFKKD